MSDVDHVAAIRRAANEVGRLHDSDLSLDIIWHTDALAKQIAEVEARAERLRKALKQADSRLIQHQAEARTRLDAGVTPSIDWFRRAMAVQESNHYAVAGLQPGDLD